MIIMIKSNRNSVLIQLMLLLAVFPFVGTHAQSPTYFCDIRNESFLTPKIFEFDLYLTQTGSTPLELAGLNTGIKLNAGFVNGGTIVPSLISGSDLNASQVPANIAYDAPSNCIKLAPRKPPRDYVTGLTSGTVISNTAGTKVCRIRLTNSADFGTEPVNYTWSMNLMPYHTVVSAFVPGSGPYVNTIITNAASHSESDNLTLFLEGLYLDGTGNRVAQEATGPHFFGPVADQITVKLAQATAPHTVLYTATNVNLYKNGKCSFSIPGSLSGSYYIIVNHRNSLETWSAAPVDFSGSAASYNFSTSSAQAYGNNMKALGSIFAIFAGDVTQDGSLGVLDMTAVDNKSKLFATGYLPEDINGDGSVGALDMLFVDNNSKNFVAIKKP